MGRLITGAGYTGTIGGSITVYGTPERQTITVADVAGTVTFDPSFNKGGDTIVLGKSASAYTIAQSGSTVVLTSGDRKVIIPVGVTANTIQFADGDRTLIYDNGFKLGDQTVTATATAISAAGSTKSALAVDASTFAARLILSAENASVGGNVSVYGTAGIENVSVLNGKVTFDPSFNKGGDTIGFSSTAITYSAVRKGSSTIITGGGTETTIPVGTTGATLDFAGDARKLVYDSGYFTIGKQLVIDGVRQIYGGARQEITTELSVWKNGTDYFIKDNYGVANNVWGIANDKNYVNGRDYWSRIFYDPASPNKGVEFFWSFPDKTVNPEASVVWSYPEVTWGKPLPLFGYQHSASVAQIKNIVSFTEKFSITYVQGKDNFSLLHDLWIFDSQGEVSGEISIWSAPDHWTSGFNGPDGYFAKLPISKNYTYSDGGVVYNLIVTEGLTPKGAKDTTYMLTPIDQNQPTNNVTIDWAKLFKFLTDLGALNPDHYIHGLELGCEIHQGSGGFIVDEFAVSMVVLDPATGNRVTIG